MSNLCVSDNSLFFFYSRDVEQDQITSCFDGRSLTLELRPLTYLSWLRVQRNSINPRIR